MANVVVCVRTRNSASARTVGMESIVMVSMILIPPRVSPQHMSQFAKPMILARDFLYVEVILQEHPMTGMRMMRMASLA